MDREQTDNSWNVVKEYGDKEERRIVDWLNHHHPDWGAQWTADKDEADITTIRGSVEVKSYRQPYRNPSIETLCVDSGKQSLWLSDTSVNYLFLNHGYHIHVYDAKKLRQIYNKGWALHRYVATVPQGDGTSKRMELVNIMKRSSIQDDLYLEDEDMGRWDCARLEEWSPYIETYTKDWTSFCS